MMKNIFILLAGLFFGVGLIFSGMTNPSKVVHFLDLAGSWDPSLFFVMLGAIPVSFFGFRWIEHKNKTIFGDELHLPGKTNINKELIIGSALFGVGWAIGGFCPGPALVAFAMGSMKAFIFVLAMLMGMLIYDYLFKRLVN